MALFGIHLPKETHKLTWTWLNNACGIREILCNAVITDASQLRQFLIQQMHRNHFVQTYRCVFRRNWMARFCSSKTKVLLFALWASQAEVREKRGGETEASQDPFRTKLLQWYPKQNNHACISPVVLRTLWQNGTRAFPANVRTFPCGYRTDIIKHNGQFSGWWPRAIIRKTFDNNQTQVTPFHRLNLYYVILTENFLSIQLSNGITIA